METPSQISLKDPGGKICCSARPHPLPTVLSRLRLLRFSHHRRNSGGRREERQRAALRSRDVGFGRVWSCASAFRCLHAQQKGEKLPLFFFFLFFSNFPPILFFSLFFFFSPLSFSFFLSSSLSFSLFLPSFLPSSLPPSLFYTPKHTHPGSDAQCTVHNVTPFCHSSGDAFLGVLSHFLPERHLK